MSTCRLKGTVLLVVYLIANSKTAIGQLPGGFFTDVKPVANINSTDNEWGPRVTTDGREIYFVSQRPGGPGGATFGQDLWVAKRSSTQEEFGPAMPVAFNNEFDEGTGSISPDGLTFYHSNNAPALHAPKNIFVATRDSINEDFGNVTILPGEVNGADWDTTPYVRFDGLEMYFTRGFGNAAVGYSNLWVASRDDVSDEFGNVTELLQINSPSDELHPSLSSDGLILFFNDWFGGDPRPGGMGGRDAWFSTRSSVDDSFEVVQNLGSPINSGFDDGTVFLSADWPSAGASAYFATNRPGGTGGGDIWQATWVTLKPGDYDRNGAVEIADYAFWKQYYGATAGLGLQADGNNDGMVGAADYTVWRNNLGSGGAAQSHIPEPSSCVLAALACAGLLSSVRRRTRGGRLP